MKIYLSLCRKFLCCETWFKTPLLTNKIIILPIGTHPSNAVRCGVCKSIASRQRCKGRKEPFVRSCFLSKFKCLLNCTIILTWEIHHEIRLGLHSMVLRSQYCPFVCLNRIFFVHQIKHFLTSRFYTKTYLPAASPSRQIQRLPLYKPCILVKPKIESERKHNFDNFLQSLWLNSYVVITKYYILETQCHYIPYLFKHAAKWQYPVDPSSNS